MCWYIFIVADSSCTLNTKKKWKKSPFEGIIQINKIWWQICVQSVHHSFSTFSWVLYYSYLISFVLIYFHCCRFFLHKNRKKKWKKSSFEGILKINKIWWQICVQSVHHSFSTFSWLLYYSYLIPFVLIYFHCCRFFLHIK